MNRPRTQNMPPDLRLLNEKERQDLVGSGGDKIGAIAVEGWVEVIPTSPPIVRSGEGDTVSAMQPQRVIDVSKADAIARGIAWQTAIGPRSENQDQIIAVTSGSFLLVGVGDGMGGGMAGRQASALAVSSARHALAGADLNFQGSFTAAEVALLGAYPAACDAIKSWAETETASDAAMASTMTLALISTDTGQLSVFHVGDTRAYLYNERNGLQQLTTDHAIGNSLTQAISNDFYTPCNPDLLRVPGRDVMEGSVLLVASDGFWHAVGSRRVGNYLRDAVRGTRTLENVVADLMKAASSNARDNQSVIAVVLGSAHRPFTGDRRKKRAAWKRSIRRIAPLRAALFFLLGAFLGSGATAWVLRHTGGSGHLPSTLAIRKHKSEN